MNVIVAADRNWAIGKDNRLLVSIPADMKLFRKETAGKVVVMGRKTLESLPNGQPLQGRVNFVLSRNRSLQVEGAVVVDRVPELLEALRAYATEDVYVIGGESVYRELLPYCDTAYVTKIDFAYEADRYFPDLDAMPEWEKKAESDEMTYFDLEYCFTRYERRA